MKKILLLFILTLSIFIQAQQNSSPIITNLLLGNPKYIKEYVIFLNDYRSFTFMSGDNEYGHNVIMTPNSLRANMKGSWFETDFCRYINNEAHYDKNGNITKEIWYYKSGKIVDDYDYTYDHLNRLITEKSINEYSKDSSLYFYEGSNKIAKLKKTSYQWKDEPIERSVKNLDNEKPLLVTKFDSISKTDSIFTITNDIWKKIGERSYTSAKDSVYNKKLSRVKIYDNQYRIIEEKLFNYEDDHENRKIYLTDHLKYEYDQFGNITKRINFNDGNLYSYIMLGNGKVISEVQASHSYKKTQYTIYVFTKDQKLERRIYYYDDKVLEDVKFEYKDNHISKLFYLEAFGSKNEQIKSSVIIFKYKFDRQKNWTEIIKNVNGKDLYKWVREIEYYK
ncbi:hypothetical protein [Chryseobacterium sp. GP-SGM7]|uniref:hypothetical protein n=1 Tax=Chryseobacterium sp. GP-SGM7 TaxID=3411323 RepID=UPI003B93DE2F